MPLKQKNFFVIKQVALLVKSKQLKNRLLLQADIKHVKKLKQNAKLKPKMHKKLSAVALTKDRTTKQKHQLSALAVEQIVK